MISRIHSAILQGIDAIGSELQADVAIGRGAQRRASRRRRRMPKEQT